jgi:ABC-type microcin C transport system duplicated ATPase subunit YejF
MPMGPEGKQHREEPLADDLIAAEGLTVAYRGARRLRHAAPVLHGVDLRIRRGETVGIVGESGSGKTTLGRALLGLVKPLAGTIRFDGTEITGLDEAGMRPLRRRMQMIFQDPMSSLNPRHTIGRILIEPVKLHGLAPDRAGIIALIVAVLDRVGLPRNCLDRYPHELSGGQRQRVGIARAVVLRPDFLLADEIVSGLDVSTQAQVLSILKDLTGAMGLTLAFISHDLSVIRSICDRIVVMQDGRVVEEGPCEQVFTTPKAAHTRTLIDAIPLPVIDPGWLSRGLSTESAAAS